MDPTAQLRELVAVAPVGLALREEALGLLLLAFGGGLQARLTAGIGLSVEGLGDGGGSPRLAEREQIHMEYTGLTVDAEPVPEAQDAGGFCTLAVHLDAPDVAGVCGKRARLEEARRPQPFVEAQIVWHRSIVHDGGDEDGG